MTSTPVPDGATVPSLLPLWPEVGRILGLSRQATYRTAKRGGLPLWPHGGRKRVVTAKLEEQIGRRIEPADLT